MWASDRRSKRASKEKDRPNPLASVLESQALIDGSSLMFTLVSGCHHDATGPIASRLAAGRLDELHGLSFARLHGLQGTVAVPQSP